MPVKSKKKVNKWAYVLIVIALLFILSSLIALGISLFMDVEGPGNVALISIEGPLTVSKPGSFSSVASSDQIVELIEKAESSPSIKAIIISINSPGGSPVATDEISNAIKESNKTTVAVIRQVGASGGYWIASSADHVIANRMSITGSIGVIGSYLEFDQFLDRYNITYQRLVAGEYKDMGSPLKELSDDEREIIQDILDEMHDEFIIEVSRNRNLSVEDTEEIATGAIFTGNKAKKLGLVDELGGIKEAEDYMNRTLNITVIIKEYSKELTFGELLFRAFSEQSFFVGRGMGSALLEHQTGIRI
ncbi:signal peptide peptidase SppA [Candidatus Woesearchaeota archaeon]|nr:signal peptide peptidase SppA [Candidatus Woesearchaeota archaeon]